MAHIVVVGAGVLGLTSALQLKQEHPEYEITVVGQHLPGDIDLHYCSPFAGANWFSFGDHNDKLTQEIDKNTYPILMKLSNDPRSGIWQTKQYLYLTKYEFQKLNNDPTKVIPWFEKEVKNFEVLKELPPNMAFGFRFDGVVISAPIYLNYLMMRNHELGNKVLRVKRLEDINEARTINGHNASIVVNATGILAPFLQGYIDEKKNYPIRGQVLHVRNHSTQSVVVEGFEGYESEVLYIMPRKEGGTIIGGSMHYGDSSANVDEQLKQRIIQRALEFMPELVDSNFRNNPSKLDVVRTNVGLRPARDGGVRIEQDPRHPWLIHNYGVGGAGYQGSYGLAQKVVKLTESALTTNAKL